MSLKRQYKSNAEKQAAYRRRKKAEELLSKPLTVDEAAEEIAALFRHNQANGSKNAAFLAADTPAQALTNLFVWLMLQDELFLDSGEVLPPHVLGQLLAVLGEPPNFCPYCCEPLGE